MIHIKQGTLVPSLSFKYIFFKNTVFQSEISEWNKLDLSYRNLASYNDFKNNILKFIRPSLTKFSNALN